MSEAEGTKGRILLIDDDQEVAGIVVRFLKSEGYSVQHANNGRAGLDIIEQEIPDLLLLDVSLPDLDGYEICRRLRGDARTEQLNILMLTGRGSVNARVTGLGSGANDYLIKPFDPQELLARIQAQLRLKALRERLVQMEKIATIGQMVITLSHEINNPLTAIVWHAELLHERMESLPNIPPDVLTSLEAIEHEAHRIREVMTRLARVTQPVVTEYLPGTSMIDIGESV
ncbi:MAG: response regulator [Anaerolineae bacterium]|nr:response regulator [Anaerolineae bacterium]MDH7473250.1 response regulator [Anaerolineae bacterium]